MTNRKKNIFICVNKDIFIFIVNWAFSRKSSEFKVIPFLNQFDYNYIKVRQMVLFTPFLFLLLNLLYLLSKAAMDCKKNL